MRLVTFFSETPEGREAAGLLVRDHLGDESLANLIPELEQSESDLAMEVLRSVFEKSPDRRIPNARRASRPVA